MSAPNYEVGGFLIDAHGNRHGPITEVRSSEVVNIRHPLGHDNFVDATHYRYEPPYKPKVMTRELEDEIEMMERDAAVVPVTCRLRGNALRVIAAYRAMKEQP